jgi:hypothetical protein
MIDPDGLLSLGATRPTEREGSFLDDRVIGIA